MPGRTHASGRPNASSLRKAVALAYEAGAGAPRVVASGQGQTAERIIALAKENDVFVHESRDLVGLLMQVELDAQIPPELYRSVAELLAWVYALEKRQPG